MIVYAEKGMVLEAEVWQRHPVDKRVIVELDTTEKATLTVRGMTGGSSGSNLERLHELCNTQFKGTLRVKVLDVDRSDPRRPRILVCETHEVLTRDVRRAAATPSHVMQRSGRAGSPTTGSRSPYSRPVPRSMTKYVA